MALSRDREAVVVGGAVGHLTVHIGEAIGGGGVASHQITLLRDPGAMMRGRVAGHLADQLRITAMGGVIVHLSPPGTQKTRLSFLCWGE